MTVHIEFLNLIIPIRIIKNKYPGGWKSFLRFYREDIGKIAWFDDHLFRYGAMSAEVIYSELDRLEKLGFISVEQRGDTKFWCDVCVLACLQENKILCDWIEYGKGGVYLKGQDQGLVIYPGNREMKNIRISLNNELFRYYASIYFLFFFVLIMLMKFVIDNWY